MHWQLGWERGWRIPSTVPFESVHSRNSAQLPPRFVSVHLITAIPPSPWPIPRSVPFSLKNQLQGSRGKGKRVEWMATTKGTKEWVCPLKNTISQFTWTKNSSLLFFPFHSLPIFLPFFLSFFLLASCFSFVSIFDLEVACAKLQRRLSDATWSKRAEIR